jgi:hypothetical protein
MLVESVLMEKVWGWRMVELSRRQCVIVGVFASCCPTLAMAGGHNPLCRHRNSGGALLHEVNTLVFGRNYERHRAEAVRRGTPVSVSVETLAQYRTAFRDLRAGRLPDKSVVLFDASNDPEPTIARLDKPIGRTILLHNVPTGQAALRNVHGNEVDDSPTSLNDYRSYAERLNRGGGIAIASLNGEPLAAALDRFIKTLGPDDVVIILSHVELVGYGSYRRTVLKLTDGSKFDVEARAPDKTDEFNRVFPNMIDGREADPYGASTFNGPTIWAIGCETARAISRLQPFPAELRTTRSISYEAGTNAALLIRGGKTRREMINALQKKQNVRGEADSPVIVRPQTDHAPVTLPGETYIFLAELNPGNNIGTFGEIALGQA